MIVKNLLPELDEQQFKKLESSVDLKDLNIQLSEDNCLLDGDKCAANLGFSEEVSDWDLSAEPVMFYRLFFLILDHNYRKISRCVDRQFYIDKKNVSRVAEELMGELVKRISNFYLRPLVAHIKKVSKLGHLQGATPEERYEDYCRRWHKDFQEDFYASYPLLQHVHTTIVNQFYTAVTEIFERVQTHEGDIRTLLGIQDTGPLELTSLLLAGDHHNGGRTGCVLVFQQGTVVYKPRSVEGEQAYYNIIQKLAEYGAPAMHAARVAVGNGYGFMEFIEREEVDFSSEDFLESSGRLAALLYALQGKDMHEENLIPRVEGPVPVDLETMLHPVHIVADNEPEIPADSAFLYKLRSISTSALLPTRLMRSDPSQGYVDIGFIQGEQGTNPFAGMSVDRPFRDDAVVRFVRESAPEDTGNKTEPDELERQRNLQAVRAGAFARGFAQMYRWICENCQVVLEIVRAECAGITLRVVVQPTMYYGQLLRMLGSPEALASEDVFSTIALRVAVFGPNRPIEVITEEAKTLLDLNIPFFMQHTNHTEIFSLEEGKTGLETRVSTLAEVLHHIEKLDENDLAEQIDQIWSAFVSPYPADALADDVEGLLQDEQQNLKDKKILSRRIADLLVAGLHPGGTEEAPYTLVAPTPGTQQQHTGGWDTAVLNSDFYSGYTGVALALAQIAGGEKTGNEKYIAAVYKILNPAMDAIFSENTSLMAPEEVRDTTFYGEPGIAFALAGAAEYLNDPQLKEAATVLGNQTAERLAQAEHPSPDYLTGQVGSAALLLGYDLTEDRQQALLQVLDRHAQDIIDGRVDEEWWSHSGFAHGISASIFALSRWNQQMPSPERAQHAVKILLERLREFDNGESWESQISGQGSRNGVWCHGTAGISLALAAVQVWMPELSTRADLERAVHHALHEGIGRNLTYCHGDLGTLDILEWVVNHVPDLPDAEKIRDILKNGYSASLLQETLEDKSVRYSLTPSYMVGTSGVLSWLTRRISGTRLYTPIIPDSTEA